MASAIDHRIDAPLERAVARPSARRDALIVLLLFLFNAAMVHTVFFPSLDGIGTWDESVYVNQGRELVEGTLPRLSQNPAVAALYALTYLPFQSSPYWLIHSCSLGRFVLFGLLWFSGAAVARQLAGVISPFVLVGLVVISPVLAGLLNNGSNALFAAMSGFAMAQLLAFHRTRALRHVWRCSFFVGIAALSRNEGPVLFLTLVALSLMLCVQWRMIGKGLLAAVVPFALVVGGYVGIHSASTGSLNLGVAQRSYITFEQGHGMAFASQYGTLQPYVEGQNDAARLFGTAEENNHSILRAISRNPQAYLARIPRLAAGAVKALVAGYNWHFALFCFALAARGIIELHRRREYALLAILLLWPAYTVLYVLLCYQAAHLLIPFPTILALTAIGIGAVAQNLNSRAERYAWSGALVVMAAAILVAYQGLNDLLAAPLLLLASLWLAWSITDGIDGRSRHVPALASLVLLACGLAIALGVVHTVPRTLGNTPDEQAALFLRDRLRPGTVVGAYGPGKVWLAGMAHAQMVNFHAMTSAEDLRAWMSRNGVEAIFVDEELRTFEPRVWQTIQAQLGRDLAIAFQAGSSGTDAVQIVMRPPAARRRT